MKEDYMDCNNHIADVKNMVQNKSNHTEYKIKQKKIDFSIPLVEILSEEDVKKLKSIR